MGIAAVVAFALLIGGLTIRSHANANRNRWRRPAAAALVTRGTWARPRRDGMPVSSKLLAAAAVAFGLITLGVFVPAGGLLALMMFGGELWWVLMAFAVITILLSGMAVGYGFTRGARALAERDRDELVKLHRRSMWHHMMVAGLFVGLALAAEIPVLGLATVPCAVGVVLSALLVEADRGAASA